MIDMIKETKYANGTAMRHAVGTYEWILAQDHRPRDFYVDPNSLFVVVKYKEVMEDGTIVFVDRYGNDYYDLFEWWPLPKG